MSKEERVIENIDNVKMRFGNMGVDRYRRSVERGRRVVYRGHPFHLIFPLVISSLGSFLVSRLVDEKRWNSLDRNKFEIVSSLTWFCMSIYLLYFGS